MNANDLLVHIKNGAKLQTHYRYNTLKLVNTLTLPDGNSIRVQDSLIDPLVREKALKVTYHQAGIKDYALNDSTY